MYMLPTMLGAMNRLAVAVLRDPNTLVSESGPREILNLFWEAASDVGKPASFTEGRQQDAQEAFHLIAGELWKSSQHFIEQVCSKRNWRDWTKWRQGASNVHNMCGYVVPIFADSSPLSPQSRTTT